MIARRIARFGLIVFLVALGLGACASKEQWAEWRSHNSHFASGDHMGFSLKNQGSTPRVSRKDQRTSDAQSWWGKIVIARADQIFEN